MRSMEIGKEDREILSTLVATASDKGYSLDEVRRGVKVLDMLDGDGALVLEEPEWAFLCNRIRDTRWRVSTKEILALVDRVLEAPEVKPAT